MLRAPASHPVLRDSPYRGYVYAYPHKTAYRPLEPARPLGEVWAREPHSNLFLYIHVPFCTMRCGFCNLFTTANPASELARAYLAALKRQAAAIRDAIPGAEFARFAIGGGTPTYLDVEGLEAVFSVAAEIGVRPQAIPTSIETSPDTLTLEKVQWLESRGVQRISIGIQSFVESETANSGRPQRREDVETALGLLQRAKIPIVNLDLIYGLPGQTVETWLHSLQLAVEYAPEELYLYPLYVRPLTGLGRSSKRWDDLRLNCYREGRALLAAQGYRQISMRMFQREDVAPPSGPAYCCQKDGMVGLGSGARSYTRALHYSLDYAVGPRGIKGIIADYLASSPLELASAHHGFALDADEQRRRYLLQSILNVEGLCVSSYRERFSAEPQDHFPELHTFAELGLLHYDRNNWRPTPLGLERSDSLGPWFFSPGVRDLMAAYEAK